METPSTWFRFARFGNRQVDGVAWVDCRRRRERRIRTDRQPAQLNPDLRKGLCAERPLPSSSSPASTDVCDGRRRTTIRFPDGRPSPDSALTLCAIRVGTWTPAPV